MSARSLSSASLDRAREVLLSSSAVSSSPSQPYSSLDSSNLQTSCEEVCLQLERMLASHPSAPFAITNRHLRNAYGNVSVQEQQLSSVVELQNLRKSLSNENSGLLDDATQLALDASWVCYDEADACDLKAVADDSARLGKPPRVRCIAWHRPSLVCVSFLGVWGYMRVYHRVGVPHQCSLGTLASRR